MQATEITKRKHSRDFLNFARVSYARLGRRYSSNYSRDRSDIGDLDERTEAKAKRDSARKTRAMEKSTSLHKPTRASRRNDRDAEGAQEANAEEKAPGCSAQNDGAG